MNFDQVKDIPREYLTINNVRFLKKLFIVLVLSIAGIGLAGSGSILGLIGGLFILGVLYAHAVELQHQCLHYTAFASRQANFWIGVALGIPMFVSFTHYRIKHMKHHQNAGSKDDTEFFQKENLQSSNRIMCFLKAFSLQRFISVVKNLSAAWKGGGFEDEFDNVVARRIRIEYRLMTILLALAVLSACAGFLAPLTLWLLPLIFVSEPLHYLIELPEHMGCDANDPNPIRNTRTIKGSRFSFWLTNGNNFHVEHHLHPRIPIDKLPSLHELIKAEIRHFDVSYFAWFQRMFSTRGEAQ